MCAGTHAHAYARPLPQQSAPLSEKVQEWKSAHRGFAAAAEPTSSGNTAPSDCRTGENWHPPMAWPSGSCLYAYANPTVYVDPNGRDVWDERIFLSNQMMTERDPARRAELQRQYDIAETRANARIEASIDEARDTGVGLYQLGKNILKANWETSVLGYASGAGSEGVDALGNGGKQIVNTIAHPIDKIYTPIHNQYELAKTLDAEGQTFQAELVRQKATIATENVLLTVASLPSAAKSLASGFGKVLRKVGAADAKVVVEGASGEARATPFNPEGEKPFAEYFEDAKAGHDKAEAVLPGGSGRAIAAHGELRYPLPTTTVPEGTTVTAARPGVVLRDDAAQLMEQGKWEELASLAARDPEIEAQVGGMRSYLPGDTIPDYTVMHPGEHIRRSEVLPPLTIMENSVTVGEDTNVSKILQPNQGNCVLAMCTKIND